MRSVVCTLVVAVVGALTPVSARAGCCVVRKLDPTVPTITLRVCEPNAAGECGSLLFAGPLALGESQSVCSQQATLVYQEAAPSEPFGPLVEAVCEPGREVAI